MKFINALKDATDYKFAGTDKDLTKLVGIKVAGKSTFLTIPSKPHLNLAIWDEDDSGCLRLTNNGIDSFSVLDICSDFWSVKIYDLEEAIFW